ncbi:hypothetical protein [Clostridium sp.]|uniref:hypothetical protein n=1 Tax=Clostridium sp. TaxID=1506 RepID=UPI0025BD6208|nr:hypothetical protein [Clostridium sp.]
MEKNSVYVYYFTIDNGLEITDIEYGAKDKIIVSYFWYSWEKEKEIKEKARKYKIYSSSKGVYFNYKGKRIYLSEFIKDF